MGAVILECIIVIMFTFLAYYGIPFLKDKKLYDTVVIAVQAAEQIYRSTGMGKEKFAYVKAWVQKTFDVDDDDLKNIIESAVYELNNGKTGGA